MTSEDGPMSEAQSVIRANDGTVTLINVFEVDAAKQQELSDLLNEGAEKVMRWRPGFVSVNVLASVDGTRVVNYAQWSSQDAIKAAMADPGVQEFAKRVAALGKPDPHPYRVVAVHRA
jgi:quinol monooxygenase YgiN